MGRNPLGVTAVPEHLLELQRQGRLRYLGVDRPFGLSAVEVHGTQREFPRDQMIYWIDGFNAAHQAAARTGHSDRLASVRSILVNPSLSDQARIRALLAIERSGHTTHEIAAATGIATTKSIADALRFGVASVVGLLTCIGADPGARPDLAVLPADTPVQPEPPPGWDEPRTVARARALAFAHEQGVITWVSPTDATAAVRTRRFVVQVGTQTHTLATEPVRAWLIGAADEVAPAVGDALYTAFKAEQLVSTG